MRRRSLFRASLVAHLVTLVLLSVLVAATVFISLRRSVTIWNVNRGQQLENLILPILSDIYRREGSLDAAEIHEGLRHILTANVYAYVFDEHRRPAYIYSLGRRTPLYDEEAVQSELARLRDTDRRPVPILDGPEVVGHLSADTVGFAHDAANRRLLYSITTAVVGGALGAVILGIVAAWLFTSSLASQAEGVAKGLRAISAGRRDVKFPATNTTELTDISDSARSLQSQLQAEATLRKQWMEDIAHDLRTPIAGLKTQLEGVSEGYLDASPARLRRLYDEVEHVEYLVEGLRELSTIESPDTIVRFEAVDICALVAGIGRSLFPEADAHRLAISCPGPLVVRADPHLIRRAVGNVVKNALQHGSTEGTIEIAVSASGGQCVVDISNVGRVDPAEIPMFFQRLYRGRPERNRGGSGLGLPITRSIVERHDGELTIQQRGARTHVLLRLPGSHVSH